MTTRLLITPGEPAGIGPDITVQIAQEAWPVELVVIADPALLEERAAQLKLPLQLIECALEKSPELHIPGQLKIIPVRLKTKVQAGQPNPLNADYVLETLRQAASLCLQKKAHAIVTGPVHKAILNEAGFAFTGHTEFFANYCRVQQTVMLFVVDALKVALVTTHLPLSHVSSAITKERLRQTLFILDQALREQFHLASPRILVCGLNPHAGEQGHLGREEIEVIEPVLNEFQIHHPYIQGPFPADTIFTPEHLAKADAILAMYHDQALPLIKYLGFGRAVNVTLGLPFIRTSVDHGTALDKAGIPKAADAGSLAKAIRVAMGLISSSTPPSSTVSRK